MKSFFVLVASFCSLSAFSAPRFYECEGFLDIEEYRVGINLDQSGASFFDNDTTSDLVLTSTPRQDPRAGSETIFVFNGPDASSSGGTLHLVFNLKRLNAELTSIAKDGTVFELGNAPCALAEPWQN